MSTPPPSAMTTELQSLNPVQSIDRMGLFLLQHFPGMTQRERPAGQVLLVVDHESVGAPVYPACIGVLGDDNAPGGEITPAVSLVDHGRRELAYIHVLVSNDHIAASGVFHLHRRDGIVVPSDVFPLNFGDAGMGRQAKCYGGPAPGRNRIHKDALARIVRDVSEYDRPTVYLGHAPAN